MLNGVVGPEVFPEIAAAAGFVAGTSAEFMAQHQLARSRQSLVEFGIAQDHQPSLFQKIGSAVVGPVAWTTAVVAGLNGVAWAPQEAPTYQMPHIEIVVDHSGATSVVTPPVIDSVNAIAKRFVARPIESEAVLASSGEVRTVAVSKVSEDQPFGEAPLEQATRIALDNDSRTRSKAVNGVPKSIGLLIVTNGNSIGDAKVLIAEAKGMNIPINIANVDPNSQNGNDSAVLKDIALQSKGNYWVGSTPNVDKIYSSVINGLKPQEVKPANQNRKNLRGLALASILAIPISYSWRKKQSATLKGLAVNKK